MTNYVSKLKGGLDGITEEKMQNKQRNKKVKNEGF